jgi:hypothetical protein
MKTSTNANVKPTWKSGRFRFWLLESCRKFAGNLATNQQLRLIAPTLKCSNPLLNLIISINIIGVNRFISLQHNGNGTATNDRKNQALQELPLWVVYVV